MDDETTSQHQSRINNVLLYIQNNINKPLTLERLAKMSYLSPYHFHRLFKSVVGENLNSHIKRVRLEKAVIQLQYTDNSITTVAYSCGYQSCAAFSKAFKQRYNMSPLNFQRKYLDNKNKLAADEIHGPRQRTPTSQYFHTVNQPPSQQRIIFAKKNVNKITL